VCEKGSSSGYGFAVVSVKTLMVAALLAGAGGLVAGYYSALRKIYRALHPEERQE
jgi:hypothetical protein